MRCAARSACSLYLMDSNIPQCSDAPLLARKQVEGRPAEAEVAEWVDKQACMSPTHPLLRDEHLKLSPLRAIGSWLEPPSTAVLWRLRTLLAELDRNGTIRVITYGGSMQAGEGCSSPSKKKWRCAYSQRFAEWLQVYYPGARILPDNRAIGGATSASGLPQLSGWAADTATTAVLLDFSVNDYYDNSDSVNMCATEVWLRRFVEEPGVVPILMDTFPGFAHHPPGSAQPIRDGKLRLARHYGVPVLRYASLVPAWYTVDRNHTAEQFAARKTALLPYSPWWFILNRHLLDYNTSGSDFGHFRHVPWPTHQLIADVLSVAWLVWASSARRLLPPLRPPKSSSLDIPPSISDVQNATLQACKTLPVVCKTPLSFYGDRGPGMQVFDVNATVSNDGNWSFYEDRPGKPGFIATVHGARLSFPLRFGKTPFFSVTYLRGYDISGVARMTLEGRAGVSHNQFLSARRADNLKVTQGFVFTGVDTGHPKMPWRILAGSTRTLQIQLIAGNKFKLISVYSC